MASETLIPTVPYDPGRWEFYTDKQEIFVPSMHLRISDLDKFMQTTPGQWIQLTDKKVYVPYSAIKPRIERLNMSAEVFKSSMLNDTILKDAVDAIIDSKRSRTDDADTEKQILFEIAFVVGGKEAAKASTQLSGEDSIIEMYLQRVGKSDDPFEKDLIIAGQEIIQFLCNNPEVKLIDLRNKISKETLTFKYRPQVMKIFASGLIRQCNEGGLLFMPQEIEDQDYLDLALLLAITGDFKASVRFLSRKIIPQFIQDGIKVNIPLETLVQIGLKADKPREALTPIVEKYLDGSDPRYQAKLQAGLDYLEGKELDVDDDEIIKFFIQVAILRGYQQVALDFANKLKVKNMEDISKILTVFEEKEAIHPLSIHDLRLRETAIAPLLKKSIANGHLKEAKEMAESLSLSCQNWWFIEIIKASKEHPSPLHQMIAEALHKKLSGNYEKFVEFT